MGSVTSKVLPVSGNASKANVVFLGGSCNPTTWRKDIAIPLLEKHNITYYNPQVDEWSDDLLEQENFHKANAKYLLFVIDNQTRAVASLVEASYYIGKGRNIILVVHEIKEPTDTILPGELKDLNRGRTYLKDIASNEKVKIYQRIEDAIQYIADCDSFSPRIQ